MTREKLAAMKKAELLDYARSVDVPGRSRMNKAQLVDALTGEEAEDAEAAARAEEFVGTKLPIPGVSQEDRIEARARRTLLYERLTDFVDPKRRCGWLSGRLVYDCPVLPISVDGQRQIYRNLI